MGNHGAGSAVAGQAGEDADDLPAQPPPKGEAQVALMIAARVKDVRDKLESQVKGLKEQLEAERAEARDAASELRDAAREVDKREAAEIADVRATVSHIEARMNDVELAVAEGKSAREKPRAERSDGSDRSVKKHAEAKEREGKKKKREVKGDELAERGGAADDDASHEELWLPAISWKPSR
ncbi:unnamed protein product [Closterium sp. Naga37s-1]|nr:unnamed protein product [Closterium sp. Naga37s-1]